MKKVLFLAVFGVFCIVLAGEALAGYNGSYCTPSPNRQFGQLNWLHEDGGILVGHLGSMRGSRTPPPECYRPPQQSYYNQRYPIDRYPRHDRPYDRQYDRHDRRGGNIGAAIAAGAAGGAVMVIVEKIFDAFATQPQPQQQVIVRERVIERPVVVERELYTPPTTPPAVSERCTTFRVAGDNQEAVWAVERALRSRGYGVSSSGGCEIAVRYEEVGDPQARIFLRVADANGSVSHFNGAQFFKRGDTLARADAIVIAARTAVSGI